MDKKAAELSKYRYEQAQQCIKTGIFVVRSNVFWIGSTKHNSSIRKLQMLIKSMFGVFACIDMLKKIN